MHSVNLCRPLGTTSSVSRVSPQNLPSSPNIPFHLLPAPEGRICVATPWHHFNVELISEVKQEALQAGKAPIEAQLYILSSDAHVSHAQWFGSWSYSKMFMYEHSEGPGKHFVYRCLNDIGCSVILSEFTVLCKQDAQNWQWRVLSINLVVCRC